MASTCPLCSAPVPESVTKGPPTTVYRCPGCNKVLTWRNGQAVASASAIAKARAEGITPGAPTPDPSSARTVMEPAHVPVSATTQKQPVELGIPEAMPVTGSMLIPDEVREASAVAATQKVAPEAAAPQKPQELPITGFETTAPSAKNPKPILLQEDWAHTQLERKKSSPPAAAAPAEAPASPAGNGAGVAAPGGPVSASPEQKSLAAAWLATPTPAKLPPSNKRTIYLAGAAIALIGLLGWASWAVFGGSNDRRPRPVAEAPKAEPRAEPKPEPKAEPKVEAKPEPKPEPKVEAKPEPKPESKAEPKPKPEPRAEPKPKSEPRAPKIVVESDKEAEKATDGTPEVKRARALYLEGNKKLFANDAKGAIPSYQASLHAFGGYVAAERGLGLAYTQLKDTPKALAAFRAYVKAAPGAKDADLIKKVIAKLEKESP